MVGNNKRTVLLVEDNVITAMEEQLSLEKYGYNVIPAYSGQEALDIFKNNSSIELILMDIDLGTGINGPDTARTILKFREVPIVFLSSHIEPEVVETTEKITSYGYVVKNSGITVLDASIKMAFRLFDAKRQIAASERKQQAMLSNIRDIIGITDSSGFVKYVSPNITRRFGWAPEDIIGTNSMSRIHTEDLEKSRAGYMELIGNNNTGIMEFRYRCKDDTYRNIEVTATNLVNDPLINGILFSYHDITDRLETENALKVSEANYRQLYENAPAGIYRVDFKTGKFVQANDVFLGYLNYTRDEITSISPFQLLTDKSKKKFSERLQKMACGETVSDTVDYEVLDKSGKIHYVHLLNKMIYDDEGHISASDVIAYEITDRVRIEKALKNSEIRVRSILGNLPGMVYRCFNDPEWRIEFVSDGAFTLTGYYPHELAVNAGIAFSTLIHPEDRSYVLKGIRDAVSRGEQWELEYRIVSRDYVTKWVYERGQVVEREQGDVKFIEGYITDITRYKQAEGAMQDLLSDRDLMLKEVHHRIKNNMNTIYGLLALQTATISEPAAVAAIKDAASRVNSMMLLYDKLYRSHNVAALSVKAYISSLADEIIDNFPNSKSVTVQKEIEDFTIDVKHLQPLGIIINELLTNIMKYAFPANEKGVIKISIFNNSGAVTVIIKDNGAGIPESVDFNNSRGFGLMLVQLLAKQLKGDVSIERGDGTSVIFNFRI